VRAAGQPLDARRIAEVAEEYAAAADPVSDLRGSAGYRRRVLPALVTEAIGRAIAGEDRAVLL